MSKFASTEMKIGSGRAAGLSIFGSARKKSSMASKNKKMSIISELEHGANPIKKQVSKQRTDRIKTITEHH